MNFRASLHRRAARAGGTVVLAESQDPRIQEAADLIGHAGVAEVICPPEDLNADPRSTEIARLLNLRKPTRFPDIASARAALLDPVWFSVGLVALGEADAAVGGIQCPTANVVRAALALVGMADGVGTVSSSFYMCLPDGATTYTFSDAGVVPDPSAEQLAEIALSAALDRRRVVGDEPIVAFLSFSSHGSASHPRVDKVKEAADRFRILAPMIRSDGELQVDAAIVPEIAKAKAPNSTVRGTANVLIFPDLDSGNIGYKLVQRMAGADAVGPILQGLARPVADLSRGASPSDVVDAAAIAILQAQPQESES